MIVRSSESVVSGGTVALDVDGVLYDWAGTARWMLEAYRGVSLQESSYWDYIIENVTKEDWDWLWNEAVELGLFRHGHVIKGAIKAVYELKDAGHRLYVATVRPATAIKDTMDWLRFHFRPWPFDEVFFLNEHQPKNTVPADVLIDDRPENVEAWLLDGRAAIIFDQPWNQDCDYLEGPWSARAFTWESVPRLVKGLLP